MMQIIEEGEWVEVHYTTGDVVRGAVAVFDTDLIRLTNVFKRLHYNGQFILRPDKVINLKCQTFIDFDVIPEQKGEK